MTEPLPKPKGPQHSSAPVEFERTTFRPNLSQKLSTPVKKGINYIIGQIVLFWPCGDEDAVHHATLSLVTGFSFYEENFKPHLEHLKNLELKGKKVAPFHQHADGVSVTFVIMGGLILTSTHRVMDFKSYEEKFAMFIICTNTLLRELFTAGGNRQGACSGESSNQRSNFVYVSAVCRSLGDGQDGQTKHQILTGCWYPS